MKRVVLFIFISIIAYTAKSKQIDETTARNVARTYLNSISTNKSLKQTGLSLADKYIDNVSLQNNNTTEIVSFYIFNLTGSKGFIIVSGEDNVEPILGYSTEGNYSKTNISPEFKYWLNQYKLQIKAAIENNIKAPQKTVQKWNDLINGSYALQKSNKQAEHQLLKTIWNQEPDYNALCPYDSSCQCLCPTGCVATAMAQILKYWNYPTTGTGFNSYFDGIYGLQNANLGGTSYDWARMPDYTYKANTAIATLMYDCGVSVDMNYGPTGSGAWVIAADSDICAQTSYVKYFGYNANTIMGYRRSQFPDSIWIDTLKNEIDNYRPIQYAGWDPAGGHTFIFDDYNSENYFHVNWGWVIQMTIPFCFSRVSLSLLASSLWNTGKILFMLNS